MPTTYMGLTLPTEDASDGLWDTILNDALELVDAHDHSSGKGVTVKTAGLEINADLPFGGFAATGVKALDLNAVAAATVASHTTALFVSSADNELYWRTSGGVNVKLTSGTSLNSALLGGFTGDYGQGDEEAEFTSGTGIFDFRVDDNTRAYIDCSDIRLFEATSGISNAVKLKSPAALASSYTLTLPAANPSGATKLLKVSTAGAAAYTGSATHDGDLTQTGTLGVSGLVTATAGVTTPANLACTGSGLFKRAADLPKTYGPARLQPVTGTTLALGEGGATFDNDAILPIDSEQGERIVAGSVNVTPASGSTMTMKVYKKAPGVAKSQLGSTQTQVGDDNPHTLSVTGLTETDPGDGTFYYVLLEYTAGSSGTFNWGTSTHDIP